MGTHQTIALVQATEGASLMSVTLWAMAYLKQLIKVRFIHQQPSPCSSKDSSSVQSLRVSSDWQRGFGLISTIV